MFKGSTAEFIALMVQKCCKFKSNLIPVDVHLGALILFNFTFKTKNLTKIFIFFVYIRLSLVTENKQIIISGYNLELYFII